MFVYIPHIPNQGFDTYTWQARYMVVDGATPSRTFTTIVDEGTTNSSLHNPTNKWLSIGTYFLTSSSYVYTTDATGEGQNTHCRNGPNGWCRMTADAVKFVRLGTTYLPDIRKDSSWNSNIIVQNLSGGNASVKLSFFNGSGNYCTGAWPVIPAHGIIRYTSSLCSVPGTVQVESNHDISIVVENRKTDVATNYVGILSAGQATNPDWNQVATELYIPTVKINHYSRTTYLHILNTGDSSTTVTENFYIDNGEQRWSTSIPLGPRAQSVYSLPDTSQGTLFSARITSSGPPLAVVVVERDSAQTQVATQQAIAGSALITYAPLIKKNYYNQTTGLRIFNPSGNLANVTVTYYESISPYRIFTNNVGWMSSNGAITLYTDPVLPDNFVGSAMISSNVGITAELQEAGPVRKMTSNVFQLTGGVSLSRTSYAVHICQNCTDGFVTGLRIQNIGNATTTILIQYYDTNGSQVGSEILYTLNMGRAWNANYIPNGLNGSAIITADQPIAVIANLANSDTNKDLAMTYNAPNR